MLKHLQSLLPLLLLAPGTKVFAQAPSQTPAAPGGSATGTEMGGELNWLWILIAVAVVIAAIWYFTKRRRTPI
jgi:hypothetical protein